MLATQLLFLGPLAIGAFLFTWGRNTFSRGQSVAKYAALALVAWLAVLFYLVMSVVTLKGRQKPNNGIEGDGKKPPCLMPDVMLTCNP